MCPPKQESVELINPVITLRTNYVHCERGSLQNKSVFINTNWINTQKQLVHSSLTKHLYVIHPGRTAGGADTVVRAADIRPRVALANCIDQEVAQQEARVVLKTQVLSIFGPCDQWSRNATGHTLQNQPLAFGHDDGAGCWWVNDARCFRGGAWKR